MKKNVVALLLTSTMLLTILTSCGNSSTGNTSGDALNPGAATESPADETADATADATDTSTTELSSGAGVSDKKAELSVFTWFGGQDTDWGAKDFNDIKCFQELEKKTNVHINWSMMSDTNTFDLMMASGDLPDVVWYSWSPARQQQFASTGLIQDISSYLPENGKNILKIMDEYPKAKKQLVTPEGQQYLIPWITAESPILVAGGEGGVIRKDWLDKLNLEVPKTADDLYTALKAFRENDMNGNGKNDEEIISYPTQVYKLLYGFGTSYEDYQLSPDGKTVIYSPTSDNYKNGLEFLHKLYAEGILDPDYSSQDGDIYEKRVMENRIGWYCDNSEVVQNYIKNAKAEGIEMDYVPMPVLEFEGASRSYYTTTKRVAQQYGSVISQTCADPALAVRWLDYMYSDEGSTIMNWGIEGESYNIVDGKKQLADVIMNDPDGTSVGRSKYTVASFAGPESLESRFAAFTDLGKLCATTWGTVDTSQAMEPYMFFTPEEQDVLQQFGTDAATARDEWRVKFILGQADLTTDWDSYLKAMKDVGVEKLLAAQQSAYDRFSK